jgi:hypothetical protein
MNAPLTGAEIETLTALVEVGPLWDGDVPSKSGRDSLTEKGYAVRVIVKLEDGYTAATYPGRDAYKKHFGNQDTMREAEAFRQAARALNNVLARSRP